jgi:hypothetical protein
MPTSRGKAAVNAYFAETRRNLPNLLRGAGRAGATVVADEIKETTPSDEVRDNVRIRTRLDGDIIKVRIDVKDRWANSVGIWLEYGTEGHFISVDDSQRRGMSVGRINERTREGSLVIGGNFVGSTVWHPGARPHPTFRPALDRKEADAIAAAQAYINTRVSRGRIIDASSGDGE